MKQTILTFPGWNINTILETDVQYLDEIMFSDTDSNQPSVNRREVVSMEDWFKEINR